MRETLDTVTTADGVDLQVRLASPPSPAAVLLLCHGLTTNADEHGAFPALRDRAVRAGMAVVRFDFRGHGSSGGNNEMLRLARLRDDVDGVLAFVDERLGPELPVLPVGLSFGGAAAVHAAATRAKCVGLVLWYAVVDYAWNYGIESPVPFTHRMRAAITDQDPPWSAMPVLGTDWFLPSAIIAETPEDPTLERLRRLTVPVLAYHGSRDTFVDPTPLRKLAATRSNVDLRIAHGAGHGFFMWRPWIVRRTVAWAAAVAGESDR